MDIDETSFLGDDTSGFFLQVGLLEGIIKDGQIFSSLAEAYHHIFRNSKEFVIILWNGLPIRLSYTRDIPFLVETLSEFLRNLSQENEPSSEKIVINTQTMKASWHAQWDENWIEITGNWKEIRGNYEAALNELGHIRMSKVAFLAEWRLLLEQLVKSFVDTGTELRDPDQKQYVDLLSEVISIIPQRGRFYHRANS